MIVGTSNHQHFDVTVVDPACPSHITNQKSHLFNGVTALAAHNLKIKKYCDLVNEEDFHPLAIECFGYWTEEVTKVVKDACMLIAEDKAIPYSVLVNYWLSKLSFVLQWENAIVITERSAFARDKFKNYMCEIT